MTLSAVAARYAHALADVVTSGASPLPPQEALGQLRAFSSALAGSLDLHTVLMTPSVPASRKRAVVGRIAEVLELAPITRNFLFVLIDHRRISALHEIVQAFELAVDERLGFARADICAARELTEDQRALVGQELERLTGKKLRSRFAIDESLIGGLVARIGSTVYDGSVRAQLDILEQRLGERE